MVYCTSLENWRPFGVREFESHTLLKNSKLWSTNGGAASFENWNTGKAVWGSGPQFTAKTRKVATIGGQLRLKRGAVRKGRVRFLYLPLVFFDLLFLCCAVNKHRILRKKAENKMESNAGLG